MNSEPFGPNSALPLIASLAQVQPHSERSGHVAGQKVFSRLLNSQLLGGITMQPGPPLRESFVLWL